MKEVKCEHCNQWTNGLHEYCEHCHGLLHEKEIKEKEALRKLDNVQIPFIKINDDDPFYTRIWKSIFRFGQIVFFLIISLIAYIASSTVH